MRTLLRSIGLAILLAVFGAGQLLTLAATAAPPLALTGPTEGVIGGSSVSLLIRLGTPAGGSGRPVALSASNSTIQVPSRVVVDPGKSMLSVRTTSAVVSKAKSVTITASYSSNKSTIKVTVIPSSLSGISLAAALVNGKSGAGTVRFSGAAYADTVVTLKASNNKLTIDTSATIPAGKTSAPFQWLAAIVSKPTAVSVTATQGSTVVTVKTVINPPQLLSVTALPNSIEGGHGGSMKVLLTAPAHAGGVLVNLNSLSSNLSVPESVTVPEGASSATVSYGTTSVTSETKVPVTADQGAIRKTTSVTVKTRQPHLIGLEVVPFVFVQDYIAAGHVALDMPAPSAGATVMLKSSNSLYVSVPASVKIEAGQTDGYFEITVKKASLNGLVLTATYAGDSFTVTHDVQSNALRAGSFADSIGYNATGTGRISVLIPAPAGSGQAVTITSSDPDALSVPASVAIPEDDDVFTFSATSGFVQTPTDVTLTFSYGNQTMTDMVRVLPPVFTVTAVTIPNPVAQGSTVTGSITIDKPALQGGVVVTLVSNKPTVASVPASVLIPEGATYASFNVSVAASAPLTSVSIAARTATGGGTSAGFIITANAVVSSIGMPPVSAGGMDLQVTIVFNKAALVDTNVTLSTSDPTMLISPSQVTVHAGQSSVMVVVTTGNPTIDTVATLTAQTGSTAITATVTVLGSGNSGASESGEPAAPPVDATPVS